MPPRRRSALARHLDGAAPGAGQAEILDAVRAAIVSGVVPPGGPVPVDEVAAAFEVSRIPVRESLKTLVGEGLVTQTPRSGYTVAQLTAAEVAELYLAREALEAAAFAVALERATAADDEVARAAHDVLAAAVRDGDAGAHQHGSRGFHLALLRPARMHRLQLLVEQAWNVTEPLRVMTWASATDRSGLHDEHAAMLAAFLARDLDALQVASGRHHRHLAATIASLPTASGIRHLPRDPC